MPPLPPCLKRLQFSLKRLQFTVHMAQLMPVALWYMLLHSVSVAVACAAALLV